MSYTTLEDFKERLLKISRDNFKNIFDFEKELEECSLLKEWMDEQLKMDEVFTALYEKLPLGKYWTSECQKISDEYDTNFSAKVKIFEDIRYGYSDLPTLEDWQGED